MPVIEVKNLTHVYKIPDKKYMESAPWWKKIFYRKYIDFYALKGISFKVESGEIIGYIGRNGAGKTTTIKILSGILEPTSGIVRVLDMEPYKNRKKLAYKISVVFGNRENVFFDIPFIDSISFFAKLYGVNDYEGRVDELAKMLDIEDLLEMPVRKMSFGQRKKANILVAFLHSPKVVFLDEPTIGLDIFAKDEVRKFLKRMNKKEDVTILLTSHYMEDIEELADRIIWIEEGKIIKDNHYDDLIDSIDYKIMEVEFIEGISEWAKEIEYETKKGNRYRFPIRKKDLKRYLRLCSNDANIKDINIFSPSLEEIIKMGWTKHD